MATSSGTTALTSSTGNSSNEGSQKTPSKASTPTNNVGSSEAYYKSHIEKLSKENKQLKQKLDILEKENRSLKKSLYELSVRYDLMAQEKHVKPFNIDNLDIEEDNENLESINEAMNQLSTPTEDNSKRILKEDDPRYLYQKFSFKGHSAAVCVIQFSPCGRFLGSGSFDKSVKVWNLNTKSEILSLQEHQLNVTDLSWSNDSSELLSVSFDHTIKEWDINKGKLINSFMSPGFVQAEINPQDNNIFYVGSTQKQLLLYDKRIQDPALVLENESMINTLYVYRNGEFVLTGDGHGFIKSWDIKAGRCFNSLAVDDQQKPISHLHVTKGSKSDEEGSYLAVNCYDDVLRIYNRASSLTEQSNRNLTLTYSLTGHKNKNWPIRSSFYMGKNYQPNRKDEKEEDKEPKTLQSSFIIATGSADTSAYLYDLSSGSYLMQKLKGHKDRVYSVNFHPTDALLATCASDTIKIWSNS